MKKKKKILQEMRDAERVKAIVNTGEIVTDSEVTLDDDSTVDNVVDKSSEAVVDEYLGEIELTHDDESDEEQANSEMLFSGSDNLKGDDSDKGNIPAPSETNSRPFLQGSEDGRIINVKDEPPEIGNPYPGSHGMLAG